MSKKNHHNSGSIPRFVVQVMIHFFFFGGGGGGGGGGSLSPSRLNIFTVGNMGVMI